MIDLKKTVTNFGKPLRKGIAFVPTALLMCGFSQAAVAFEADQCEFIRSALSDPKVTEIVIPEGTYICRRPIILNRNGASLVGQGRVILKLADHANCPLLILGNVETPPKLIYDINVANLTFEGNRENQDMECWSGPCDSEGVANIRNNGITIRGVHRAHIKNVNVFRMRSGGVVTEKGCTKLHIDGLVSKYNYFDGFAGYETEQSTFDNLDLSENLGAGISLDIKFNRNTFRQALLKNNKDVSIFMRDSNKNVFTSFEVIDSGSHGVFVSHVEHQDQTSPQDNIFEDFIISGTQKDGFHINGWNSTGNQLINVNFKNIKGQEIFEETPGILKISRQRNNCENSLERSIPIPAILQRLKLMRERGGLVGSFH